MNIAVMLCTTFARKLSWARGATLVTANAPKLKIAIRPTIAITLIVKVSSGVASGVVIIVEVDVSVTRSLVVIVFSGCSFIFFVEVFKYSVNEIILDCLLLPY